MDKNKEIKVWFEPERKMFCFYNSSGICVDFFLEEREAKVELYDGDRLLESKRASKQEIDLADVENILERRDLASIK